MFSYYAAHIKSEIKEVSVKLVNMHGDQLHKPPSVNVCIYLSSPSEKASLPFPLAYFNEPGPLNVLFQMLRVY